MILPKSIFTAALDPVYEQAVLTLAVENIKTGVEVMKGLGIPDAHGVKLIRRGQALALVSMILSESQAGLGSVEAIGADTIEMIKKALVEIPALKRIADQAAGGLQ